VYNWYGRFAEDRETSRNRASWPTAWFCYSGPVHWELLPKGTIVSVFVQVAEMEQVSRRLHPGCQEHRDKIVLFDIARPHRAKDTRATLERLGFEELIHPPYFMDISPCDYHVFRSL